LNQEQNHHKNQPVSDKSLCIQPLIKLAAILILIPVIAYIGISILFSLQTNYYIFTNARIEKMEGYFNIIVTDDVKLLHFVDSSQFIAIDQTLTLEVEDYERFLAENVNADIEPTASTAFQEKDTLYYSYVPLSLRTDITISSSKNEGKYIITLHHYE
jgi:hypothetical protein